MWDTYKCENMQDFHNVYVKLDVVLSADCMENLRRVGIEEYGIDPVHCWTLAGYTWHCCLKMTNLELQPITDLNIYHKFENAIKSGVSTVSYRYSKANIKYFVRLQFITAELIHHVFERCELVQLLHDIQITVW